MLFSMDPSEAPNSAHTPEELAFVHAVECSDSTTVRRLMGENPTLNVNVIDALGRTALRLAVRNENRELVDMLLEHCNSQNIQQAVLQAISEDHTSIAELMLKHPCYLEICRKRKRLGDVDGFFTTEVESQFSTDMTPLNLAAQKNNYAIVQLLLQRGELIPKPHKFSCSCIECRNRMKFDQLRMANFRLNAYRGLASEAYISLSSDDPILTGFQLAKELRRLSDDEKHFKKEYKDLANRLSDYTVKLLDRVWTQQELNLVLDKTGSASEEKYEELDRLKLALDNGEKKFVAHPSVQQHVMRIWHNGLQHTDTHCWLVRCSILAVLTLIYPVIIIVHLVKPHTKMTRLVKQPLIKFLAQTMSFLAFLLLLIYSSIEVSSRVSNKITLGTQYPPVAAQYKLYRSALGQTAVPYGEDFPLRPRATTVTEYLITIWVAGMVVQEVQQVLNSGVKAHFSDLFNVVDFCLLFGYIGALGLSQFTLRQVSKAVDGLEGKNVTFMLRHRAQTNLHLYWLNTDRMQWSTYDPTNMSEGLFAFSNVISFARIVNILLANESLGPMQISLSRMVGDFVRFLLFTSIAMIAFIVSLRNLYWWYTDPDNLDNRCTRSEDTGICIEDATDNFADFLVTFRTVFWWIYGRGAFEYALDLPQDYTSGEVTTWVGNLLAGVYHITIIIVLVNLLIAMMARSFERIVGDVDTEWKYARTVLYMEYINDNAPPPVPLNLLTLVRDAVVMAAGWLRRRVRDGQGEGDDAPPAGVSTARRPACINLGFSESSERLPAITALNGNSSSAHNLRSMTTANSEEEVVTYKDITQTIVQRYIFDIQREEEISSDNNLEEARVNLFHTKWDLLELLEMRDNSVCHLSACLQEAMPRLSALARKHYGDDSLPATAATSCLRRRNRPMSKADRVETELEDYPSDKTITYHHPKTDIITPDHPSNNVIISDHPNNVITPDHPSNNIITPDHPSNNVITSDHPDNNVITPDHPKTDVIISDHSDNNVITSDHPNNNVITSDHPKTDVITSDDPSTDVIISGSPV